MLDRRGRQRFLRHKGALVGAGLVLVLIVFAVFGPLLAQNDPLASDFVHGVSPVETPVGPSARFLLGVDRLYRDQFARLAVGARLSLSIAIAATALASLLGAIVGILAGYHEGSPGIRVPYVLVVAGASSVPLVIAGHPRVALAGIAGALVLRGIAALAGLSRLKDGVRVNLDGILMRIVDVGLAFPFLLLVMALGAAIDETSAVTILLVLGLTGWLGTARVIRAKTLQVRGLEFVQASRALGQPTWAVLLRHVVPNVAGPLVVIATVSVAQMIVAESVLSYLGAGLAPPTPTWGRMLAEGQDYYLAAPWLLAAPGLAILVAVLGFNLLGEGLRDALDPRET